MDLDTFVAALAGVRDVAMAVTAGALVLVAAVLPVGSAAGARAVRVATVAAATWALAATAFILVSYRVISQTPVSDPGFGPQVWSFVTDVPLGQAYAHMALAAIVVSIAAGLVRTPAHAAWALVPVIWALGWQAVTGHAAGAIDHHLAVSAMALHLAGSALWLGVLVGLVLTRRLLGSDAADAVRRTSRLAGWAAGLIVVSGVANTAVRLGSAADLWGTAYGRLLFVKLILVAGVIALAAWHRRVALPRLTDDAVAARFWRVMAVDVAALVAVVGIAVALAATPPPRAPVPVVDASPAFQLTGFPLPPSPTFAHWFTTWRLEIIVAFVLLSAAVTYLRWVRRLRARGDAWPWHRTVSWLAGLAMLAWVTQGAPTVYGMVTFSGHMVEHMALVMLVPLPLTFGAPVTLALRALAGRTDGSRGPREWLRAVVDSRLLRFFAQPVVAAVNFAGSLVVFYYTPLFEFVLRNHAGHLWMVLHFVAVGYFFANALVGLDPGPSRLGYPLRIVMIFATMAFHAFFGVSLMASETLLAPTWYGLMGRDWGGTAIADQQYGGQLAWGLGEFPVLVLALGVILAWRRADDKDAVRKDRQAERDDDAELRAYNAMLSSVATRDKGVESGV